jgi:hypothetical protein
MSFVILGGFEYTLTCRSGALHQAETGRFRPSGFSEVAPVNDSLPAHSNQYPGSKADIPRTHLSAATNAVAPVPPVAP